MAWFGEGFSNLRGQITNFTKEVLSDVREENYDGDDPESILNSSIQRVHELETLLSRQEIEISNLKVENQDLQAKLRVADSRNDDGWNRVELEAGNQASWDDDGALFDVALDNFQAAVPGAEGTAVLSGRDAEVEALRKRLHRAHRDNQQVTDRNLELERKIKELTANLEKNGRIFPNISQSQIEDQSEMIIKLKNQVEKQDQETKRLQTLLDKSQEEKNQLEINFAQTKERLVADEKAECDATSTTTKEREKLLTVKAAKLKHRLGEMKSERDAYHKQKDTLEEQLKEAQAECKRQTDAMVELDEEYQIAIEQMIELQKSLKDRIEFLENELQSSKNETATQDACNQTNDLATSRTSSHTDVRDTQEACSQTILDQSQSSTQTDVADETSAKVRQALTDLIGRVVLFPIPSEYISPDDDDSDGMAQARVLARLSAGLNWKKETLERKVAELMQQTRKQEDECSVLRGNFDAFVQEMMSKNDDERSEAYGLAPIPERGEEQEQRINAIESENEVLREMRANLETEVNRLRSDLGDLEARLVDEKNLHIEYQNRANLSHEDAELHGLQAVAAMREELEQAKSQLDDELFASREETAAVRQQLEDVLEEKANLLATLDTAKTQLNEVSNARSILAQKLNDLQSQFGELERETQESREQLDNKQDECESLKLQLIEQSRYISDSERLPNLENERDQYQAQAELHRAQAEQLAGNKQKLEHEIENLKQVNERLSNLEKERDLFKAQNEIHRTQIEQLAANKQKLEHEIVNLSQANERLSNLEKEREQHQAQAELHRTQLEQLADYIQKLEYEIENLKQANTQLEIAKTENIGQVKQLTKQLEESTEQIILLQNLVKNFEDKLQETNIKKQEELQFEENVSELKNIIQSKEEECNRLLTERNKLMEAVKNKHQENVQYHNEIQRLGNFLTTERTQLEERHRQLANTQEELLATKNRLLELETAAATASTTKSSLAEDDPELVRLRESLSQEQARNVYLQNEVQEQHEKEAALTKELERLRAHLMSVEEAYTVEALASAHALTDAQTRAKAAEERIKNASTAYTSANILAQQQVESLQSQARSATLQREELQGRLAQYEADLQQQAEATANLQAVLEQFQRDKERDIINSTERLRGQLKSENNKHEELLGEISTLKVQINELRDVQSTNQTLREQLERKIEQAASLSEQVFNLKHELKSTAEKIDAANGEGKVDRNLLKNLMIGYLSAPVKNREQVLKIIGNVLEFNQEEREKSGLDPLSDKNKANLQSLSEAFVRFLENESRPQPNLRLLPEIPQSPGNASTEASPQVGNRRSPSLLLADVNLPQFPQIASGRSSSTILKDVLKKS